MKEKRIKRSFLAFKHIFHVCCIWYFDNILPPLFPFPFPRKNYHLCTFIPNVCTIQQFFFIPPNRGTNNIYNFKKEKFILISLLKKNLQISKSKQRRRLLYLLSNWNDRKKRKYKQTKTRKTIKSYGIHFL